MGQHTPPPAAQVTNTNNKHMKAILIIVKWFEDDVTRIVMLIGYLIVLAALAEVFD